MRAPIVLSVLVLVEFATMLSALHIPRKPSTIPRHLGLWMSSSVPEVIRTLEPGSHVSEMEVKKSRFIGYAKKTENWEEAKSYIDQIKQEHPKARHWCYGFQCGYNPVQERSNDDGEPQGTAGAPILGAIKGEELSDVVCVVVRYFGGIKLGAGGLIRAYGAAARQVLREAPVVETQPKASFSLEVDASYVGSIYENLSKSNATPSGEEYRADGKFAVTVTCELASKDSLQAALGDATKGSVVFSKG
jgi:uncharacterized YigZ family protein